MNFCTNCGEKLDGNHAFCTECGASQKQQRSYSTSSSGRELEEPVRHQSVVKKPWTKKRKIITGAVSLLFVTLLITHFVLLAQLDPIKGLQEMDEAIQAKDTDLFLSHIDLDDQALIHQEQYMDYLIENGWEQIREDLVVAMTSGEDLTEDSIVIQDKLGNRLFEVMQEEVLFGIYYTYSIQAVPVSLYAISNTPGSKITYEDREFTANAANQGIAIGTVYPGEYTFNALAPNDFGELTYHGTYLFDGGDGENQYEIFIDFPTSRYKARSNVEDAVLFVDGKSTGKTLEQFENLGPFPEDKAIIMHIEWEAPNGKMLKSAELTQDDAGWYGFFFEVDEALLAEAEESSVVESGGKDAGDAVLAFRAAYEKALNNRDYSLIAPFLLNSSDAEAELKKYVGDLKDENYKYEFTFNEVEKIEMNFRGFKVLTKEQFVFENHRGERTFYDRSKIYTVVKDNDEYKISKIDIKDTDRNEL